MGGPVNPELARQYAEYQKSVERVKAMQKETDDYVEAHRVLIELKLKELREERERRNRTAPAPEPKERIVYVPYPVYVYPSRPFYQPYPGYIEVTC